MSGAQPSPLKLTAVDTNTAEWERLPLPEIGAVLDRLPLIADPDTGMEVLKVVCQAGFTNPWHTHNCAHGIYVLDGTLTTHQGNYPAGSFVRFPEGGTMTHGATDDGDCTFLFITNKPFDIQYVGDRSRTGQRCASRRAAASHEARRSLHVGLDLRLGEGAGNCRSSRSLVTPRSARVSTYAVLSRPCHERWLADFTYVAIWSRIVYAAFVVDLFSQATVGWSAATSKRAKLGLDALDMALWRQDRARTPAGPGLIHHSDAGSRGGFNRSSQHPDLGGVRRGHGGLEFEDRRCSGGAASAVAR